ncbi:SDR family NAD(P)-dependent oxidoreductase [Psychrosphaera haliotis]|nr:SDR family NAD(P)-dependent oxidoreductase [Psychrosphaera haliotis]
MKTILITGSTDGLGLATATKLLELGHQVIIHGRNEEKLASVHESLLKISPQVSAYQADFSDLSSVLALANTLKSDYASIDVLINNAGVFKLNPASIDKDKVDPRLMVNTIAPYVFTKALHSNLSDDARVINLSSAAQAPFDLNGILGTKSYSNEMQAYAESKLAITVWTLAMAKLENTKRQVFLAVNPGSLLATKMVKAGFGVEGNDISIGVNLLTDASLSDSFKESNGKYFDNDKKAFATPDSYAANESNQNSLIALLDKIYTELQ